MSKLITAVLVTQLILGLGNASVSSRRTVNCPDQCNCQHSMADRHLTVDCSNRGLQAIPTDIDRATVHLDLSGNQILRIPAGAFKGLSALRTIRLNDNWISEIANHAFRGLSLKTLDLHRNSLVELTRDSLAGLRAHRECSITEICAVNLQENPLRVIRSYSLSWIKGLSFLLGVSPKALTIEAYAFYGAENITQIRISNITSVSIEPRVFTNTNFVKSLQISNANLKSLPKFTFEGLRNIDEISFRSCYFNSMDEFSFSGIIYTPARVDRSNTTRHTESYSMRGGGLLNISNSVIPSIHGDTFRDTNLANLVISQNDIQAIEGHAFRGLHALSLLEISGNRIGYVQSEAFGGLKNIPHLKLTQNDIGTLREHAFRDSNGIEKLSLHLRPNSNMTIGSYSFSGLRDVGLLDIKGAPGSTVWVRQDAFHDLGGVRVLRIANISLPTLRQHTFRGLSKVQTIKLEYCNISRIDAAAFGEPRVSGAVATIEMKDGNNLPCDCDTNKLLRDFENRFSKFTITCYTASAKARTLTADTLDWPSCAHSAANRPVIGSYLSWLVSSSVLIGFLSL